MSSPYSNSQAIVAEFVPTTPSPSNPHSIIPSEGSPTVSQQTYLSPHSVISSAEASQSPASSSTRSPQSVPIVEELSDSKTPVIYNAANNSSTAVAGAAAVWSQPTSAYYPPPPPPQYDDKGLLYANAQYQQQQQPQSQSHQQPLSQQHQHQHQQQQSQQPYDLAPSFPMYAMRNGNANNNDPDHLKPPTNTDHMEIIGSGFAKDPKSKKKKEKCWCFLIILSIILAIVLGVLFGVVLKKNDNDVGPPSHSDNPSISTSTIYPGFPTSMPAPTGVPDFTSCVLKCQGVFTACTQSCGSSTDEKCHSGCFSAVADCSIGCTRISS